MENDKYVLGFLLRDDNKAVVLIRKNKPQWQSGLLNGVGGKREPNEPPNAAMVREFREETGVDTAHLEWNLFAFLTGKGFSVHCFKLRHYSVWLNARTCTSEAIEKHHNPSKLDSQRCVSNLGWLVQMAMDDNGGKGFVACVSYYDNA